MNAKVLSALKGLMLADTFGDVHSSMDELRLAIGLPELEGNYLDGWTAADWRGVDDSIADSVAAEEMGTP